MALEFPVWAVYAVAAIAAIDGVDARSTDDDVVTVPRRQRDIDRVPLSIPLAGFEITARSRIEWIPMQ